MPRWCHRVKWELWRVAVSKNPCTQYINDVGPTFLLVTSFVIGTFFTWYARWRGCPWTRVWNSISWEPGFLIYIRGSGVEGQFSLQHRDDIWHFAWPIGRRPYGPKHAEPVKQSKGSKLSFPPPWFGRCHWPLFAQEDTRYLAENQLTTRLWKWQRHSDRIYLEKWWELGSKLAATDDFVIFEHCYS